MYSLAFGMGILGSLHCAGMCGPLALMFSNQNRKGPRWLPGLLYNGGRTLSYMALGLIFGGIGTVFFFADVQKSVSVILGLLMVLSFLFSINIDSAISNSIWGRKIYQPVRNSLQKLMSRSERYPSLIIGMVNGLLPCGMVYLALAGALTMGGLLESSLFMMFFGLGTLPMMFLLSSGLRFFPIRWRLGFQRVLPVVTLLFGLFLIFRGFSVYLPEELNFWVAIKNPLMCH